jgi:WD40 repeat protein
VDFALHEGNLRSMTCVLMKNLKTKKFHARLVTIAHDKTLAFWNLSSGECVRKFTNVTHDPVCLISLALDDNPDETVIVSGATNGSVKFFWPNKDLSIKAVIKKNVSVNALEKIDNKNMCATLSNGFLCILSINGENITIEPLLKGLGVVSLLRYIGEKRIGVVFNDGTIKIFNIENKQCEYSISFLNESIVGIEVLSDKKLLICLKSGLWTWDLVQGNKSELLLEKQKGLSISAFLRWNATKFIIGCDDGACYRYDEKKRSLSCLKKTDKNRIVLLEKSSNNKLLIASSDGDIKQLSLNGEKLGKTFQCADGDSPVGEDRTDSSTGDNSNEEGLEDIFEIEDL